MCQNPSRASPGPNSKAKQVAEADCCDSRKQEVVQDIAQRLATGNAAVRVAAAREVRRLARTSTRARSAVAIAPVVEPLVTMLSSQDPDARKSALLALLNMAVRNERNKDTIVNKGALPHFIKLLKSESKNLRELAVAAVLTLSASQSNKSIIAASGAVPFLVEILISGSIQGKVDAVTTLYNLSTCVDSSFPLPPDAVKPLLSLLKDCKKYSKFAEKATALLEILCETDAGRNLIGEDDGAIFTLVEIVEDGSTVSTQHAVAVLLSLCQSCRDKFRALILKEGAIPGLLLLTVQGTQESRAKARNLLDLLREQSKSSSYDRRKLLPDVDGSNATDGNMSLCDVVMHSVEFPVACQ